MRKRTALLLLFLAACLPPPPNRNRAAKQAPAASSTPTVTLRPATSTRAVSSPPPPMASSVGAVPSPEPPPPVDAGAPPPAADASSGFVFQSGSPRDFFAHDNDALARYLQQERTPGWGAHADVAAGSADEWIMDVFQYALVISPDVSGFWYRDFGKGDVEGVAAVPLTRADKKDVVVRTWVNEGELRTGYRHLVLEVWSFGAEGPVRRFAQEVSIWAMCCGSEANAPPRVSTTVSFHDGAIDLKADAPWRVDARFKPGPVAPLFPGAGGASSAPLLPMMPADVKRRLYTWDGKAFVLAREEKSG